MKILLATFWLVPHVGGVWNFMVQLKNRLEALGHTVDLMGNSPDYTKYHMVNRGAEMSKSALLPMLEAKLSPAQAPGMNENGIIRYYELERYCMELSAAFFGLDQYDLIHTQDIFSARAFGRVKPKHIPLITHVHGSVARELHEHFRKNPHLGIAEGSVTWNYFSQMEYYAGMTADLTITANQWSKNMLVHGFGVPDYRVTAFPYGLETGPFYAKVQAGTPYQRPFGKKVIICPARLVYVKGVDVLLSALHILKGIRSDWVCWIVGDGDMREALQQQSAQAGLQNDVVFFGERSDVPAMLMQSDIFVHSCYQDNQPFSVMEAQLAGLPCAVSDAGGLPEMVQHGHTGMISPAGDFTTLASHLNILLEHDEYRCQLGRNAKAWGEAQWSMDKMIDRMMTNYYSAIAQKQ